MTRARKPALSTARASRSGPSVPQAQRGTQGGGRSRSLYARDEDWDVLLGLCAKLGATKTVVFRAALALLEERVEAGVVTGLGSGG